MPDRMLAMLAREAGIAVNWIDAAGMTKTVAPESLRPILAALGYPAGDAAQIADSLARLRLARDAMPPLAVVKPGGILSAAVPGRGMCLIGEDGRRHDLRVEENRAAAPTQPGYYRDAESGRQVAVTPRHAFSLSDIAIAKKFWGIAVQLYALRDDGAFGDFASLADFASEAAAAGADTVAISPVHALFGAVPDHISPYSPSTRLFLNPLYATADHPLRTNDVALIEWPNATAAKLAALKANHRRFLHQRDHRAFADFVSSGGARLLAHARFEVLDRKFRARGCQSWRDWPALFQNVAGPAVQALAPGDPDVAFQLFLQWRAETGLAAAQHRAKQAGMAVGLITDMAVGMDPAGSHAWSAPGEVLRGLSVGAPPDIYNRRGQNWGLTNFSPPGLRASGYEGFIGTLRAAMRHAGGIRLDHAMGLARLWVVPDGACAADGAYLQYPFDALLGLLMLESWRHRALVIAEDLGTVPKGFRGRIAKAGLLGMRVLWFERDGNGDFLPPSKWDRYGAALSTTHDLPTLTGWWSGHDIAWRAKTGIDKKSIVAERAARSRERRKIWKAIKAAGCAGGAMPGPTTPARFADAAVAFLAKTPCPLALLPIEDFVGERDQPNIPGTIDEHPNWRRRLKQRHPLQSRAAKARAALLEKGRA